MVTNRGATYWCVYAFRCAVLVLLRALVVGPAS